MAHRTIALPDGRRLIQRGDEATGWEDVVTVGPDDVYGPLVRLADDIRATAIPGGILLEIAGVRHGIPLGLMRQALPAIVKLCEGG